MSRNPNPKRTGRPPKNPLSVCPACHRLRVIYRCRLCQGCHVRLRHRVAPGVVLAPHKTAVPKFASGAVRGCSVAECEWRLALETTPRSAPAAAVFTRAELDARLAHYAARAALRLPLFGRAA